MGKPQMEDRESGGRNDASSGWRAKCRSARTRRVTISVTFVKDSVTFAKKLRKEERTEAHPFVGIPLIKMRKPAGGQNGRHNAA